MKNKKSIHAEVEAIKKREHEELIEALREYGEVVDCGYEYHFEGDSPVVAGYSYDEPCDITVKAVRVDKHGDIYLIGDDSSVDDIDIPANEVFAGHLDCVTSALVGECETDEEGVWLVVQHSCVDGEHLHNVIPCNNLKTARQIMKDEWETILDESPKYADARRWIEGNADPRREECPYSWCKTDDHCRINIELDAYYEDIKIMKKKIQY